MRDQALPAAAARPRAGLALRRLGAFAAFARRQPSFALGLVIVALTLFLAAFGPLIGPYHPEHALPGEGLLPPSMAHWMGTDVSGMDIFSRVIAAPRIDLTIALASSLVAFVLGVALGVVSGFFSGAAGLGRFVKRSDHARRRHPPGISDLHLRAGAGGLQGPGRPQRRRRARVSQHSLFPARHARLGAPGARAAVRGSRPLRRQLRTARGLRPRHAERA